MGWWQWSLFFSSLSSNHFNNLRRGTVPIHHPECGPASFAYTRQYRLEITLLAAFIFFSFSSCWPFRGNEFSHSVLILIMSHYKPVCTSKAHENLFLVLMTANKAGHFCLWEIKRLPASLPTFFKILPHSLQFKNRWPNCRCWPVAWQEFAATWGTWFFQIPHVLCATFGNGGCARIVLRHTRLATDSCCN